MPARNPFIPVDPEADPSYVDPALVMNTPLPSVPATPMDGGSGFDSYPSSDSEGPGGFTGHAQDPNWRIEPIPSALPNVPAPGNDDNQIQGWGSEFLGRTFSDADLQQYFRGQPLATVMHDIANSPEAAAYAKAHQAPSPAPAGGGTSAAAPAPNFSPSGAGFALPDTQLGDTVDSGLGDLIHNHGMTPEQTSLLTEINKIIGAGGALPSDNTLEQQQLEGARENEAQAFGSQLGDARDELASKGLVSEPGVPQGSEADAISEITRHTAPAYAQAVRDISSKQIDTQNNRLVSAISAATGLTGDASRNLVTSLGTGSQRQLGLASIALDSLSQNMQWNEFLATYGLNRDQVMYSIQNGNIGSLMTLLSLFEQRAGLSAGGHI